MPRIGKSKHNWRKTLEFFQIHTKTGKEKFLSEVARAYEMLYPARARYLRDALKGLRKVTTGGYTAGTAGEMYVQIRVPTELWLFIQRWIPDFGKDSKDIELLSKVWCDLVRGRDYRRRTPFYVSRYVQKSEPEGETIQEEKEKTETESEDSVADPEKEIGTGGDTMYPEDKDRGDAGADLGGNDCQGLCRIIRENTSEPEGSVPTTG